MMPPHVGYAGRKCAGRSIYSKQYTHNSRTKSSLFPHAFLIVELV